MTTVNVKLGRAWVEVILAFVKILYRNFLEGIEETQLSKLSWKQRCVDEVDISFLVLNPCA
jgi:hypothetical protein